MRERDRKLDSAKLDRPTRRLVESLKAARKKSGREEPRPSSSEAQSAAGRMALWADETARKHKRSGVDVPSHKLLDVPEQEYRQMAKKRPWAYWGTPKEKDVLAAAKVYNRHRSKGH
jgi:hypothetical protein